MEDLRFLSLSEVLDLHELQIKEKGGAPEILSKDKLESAVQQPQQTFGGEYLYPDLFAMAAAYLTAIVRAHPFLDGNKRTATHAAIIFLYLNGYEIQEFYETELADLVYDYLEKEKTDEDIADFLASRAKPVQE
ncbi:type II toxin-antitoxin system death-on-curing family toxin [Halalkalibaculum sp. DA3122]|uniref:type II toxin-antitoxin system death-on-curing family toxin n=1 Tax=Halalkalibaculum sp. DA3122 TaxID=3373607 RepID=UPI003753FAD0